MPKIYKSIAYAFATSPMAKELGFYDTGCFYVQTRYDYNTPTALHNAEGYLKAVDAELIADYMATDGQPCPMFLRHGNTDALRLIKTASKGE